jgi:hypothetical protein
MKVTEINGYPGTTRSVTSSNTAQALTSSYITNGTLTSQKEAIGLVVTCETNDVRVTWCGTAPTTSSGTAFGHILTVGQSLRINNPEAIKNFKYVSKTAGSHGVLHYTPEYYGKVI